ncbi:MAG: hypothetical protein HDQ95_11950 [Roseburia sp.]|nr:hypothetical protein [Roseburia sp.]
MIKVLSDIKLPTIPFLPNMVLGKQIIHAKIIELNGMSDHDKRPDMAMSQIREPMKKSL